MGVYWTEARIGRWPCCASYQRLPISRSEFESIMPWSSSSSGRSTPNAADAGMSSAL